MSFNVYAGLLVALTAVLGYCFHLLTPLPYPGNTPYNPASIGRPLGDLSDIKRHAGRTGEFSDAVFSIARRLRSPVAQLLLARFAPPAFIVDDAREAEDILVRRAREFDRSELATSFFSTVLPHCTLAQLTTPALRAQKRMWSDAMSHDFLRRVVAPNTREGIVELVGLWRLKAAGGWGQVFDATRDLNHAAFDSIWAAIVGSKLGTVRRELELLRGSDGVGCGLDAQRLSTGALMLEAVEHHTDIAKRAMATIWPGLTVRLLQASPKARRQQRAIDVELRRLMRDAVDRFQRISAVDGDDVRSQGEELDTCAMDLVLRRKVLASKKAGEPNPDLAEDPAIYQELLLLLLAGFDSTSMSFGWFVKLIAANAAAQGTLRRALHESFPGPGLPSSAEILDTKIPYLDAFVEEAVRVSAVAGIITRRATVDAEVLGHRVPAGANLVLNTRFVHARAQAAVPEALRSKSSRAAHERRQPRGGLDGVPGQDLHLFEPRRWLATDAAGGDVFDANSLPTLVFGGGLRGCFGKKLALQSLRIMFTLLTLSFEFLPLPEELSGMEATETLFRRPKMAHVHLRPIATAL